MQNTSVSADMEYAWEWYHRTLEYQKHASTNERFEESVRILLESEYSRGGTVDFGVLRPPSDHRDSC
jgi:hypothetical protein